MPVHPAAYLILFAVPALLPLSWWLGRTVGSPDLLAFLPIIVLQVLVPVLDWLIGDQPGNLGDDEAHRRAAAPYFRSLPVIAALLQPVLLIWAAWVAASGELGWIGLLGWTLSTGYVGGILAINVAHELIHKRSRGERLAGGLALATVCYGTFKVEHVRGHHVHVATPEDASSAPLGRSLFAFLPGAIIRNVYHGWRLAARPPGREGPVFFNEVLGWTLLSVLLGLLFGWWLGGVGLLFFAGQSLVAILSLETINYIEHYGLRRQRLDGGRYERPDPRHSWNSDAVLSNLFLLQLARHSDHHANATRPYPALRHFDQSPQLPAGYGTMFLLAWMPPLWRRVMDPRALAYRQKGSSSDQIQASASPSTSCPPLNSP